MIELLSITDLRSKKATESDDGFKARLEIEARTEFLRQSGRTDKLIVFVFTGRRLMPTVQIEKAMEARKDLPDFEFVRVDTTSALSLVAMCDVGEKLPVFQTRQMKDGKNVLVDALVGTDNEDIIAMFLKRQLRSSV